MSIGYMDNTPAMSAGNRARADEAQQRRDNYIAKLRETGDPKQACAEVGISRMTLCNWRKYNPTFRAQYNEACITNTKRVLAFVRKFYIANGNFPTVREIKAGVDATSTSLVCGYLRTLERNQLVLRIGESKRHRYTLPEVLEALKSL